MPSTYAISRHRSSSVASPNTTSSRWSSRTSMPSSRSTCKRPRWRRWRRRTRCRPSPGSTARLCRTSSEVSSGILHFQPEIILHVMSPEKQGCHPSSILLLYYTIFSILYYTIGDTIFSKSWLPKCHESTFQDTFDIGTFI